MATLVEALRRERDGYLARGLTDRAEQVAEQLAAHGAPVEPGPKRKPRRRA